ncbi:MAG: DUF1638 domain-containing protein [Puniceicoccaceae bacterium]
MSFDLSHCAILSCDVFQEELFNYLESPQELGAMALLEMGLHDQPDVLRQEVQKTIDRLEAMPNIETILLLYGVCGNGLIGIQAKRCQLVIPRAHDCISILLGSPDKHQAVLKENPGTYFYSPGWVRGRRVPGPDRDAHLLEFYSEKYPDDEEMVEDLIEADHETYEHHNCAAYVDLTENAGAESYCKDCAASLGWQYRRLQGDASLLKDFLSGNWDDARFLVAGPGQPIEALVEGSSTGIQG